MNKHQRTPYTRKQKTTQDSLNSSSDKQRPAKTKSQSRVNASIQAATNKLKKALKLKSMTK